MKLEVMKRPVDKYYIITNAHTSMYPEGVVLFWGPNKSGYTSSVDKAGLYTFEEAKDIQNPKLGDYMVPQSEVEKRAFKVVEISEFEELASVTQG